MMTMRRSREDILKDVKEALGTVPGFIEDLPDDVLEHEWEIWKNIELKEGKLPAKYKLLISLATASALHCEYCIYADREFAKASGVTEEEIKEAMLEVKLTAGWSLYFDGIGYDFEKFKREVKDMTDYIKSQGEVKAA